MSILDDTAKRIELTAQLKRDIDAACVQLYADGFRTRLGAGVMGEECDRFLWYGFRWAFVDKAESDGRMQRLFNRGYIEEARMLDWLRAAGFDVYTQMPQILHWHPESDSYFWEYEFIEGDGLVEDVTGYEHHHDLAEQYGAQKLEPKAYHVEDCDGHFGGGLDAVVYFPAHYGIDDPAIAEAKTNSTGRGFNDLLDHGCRNAKWKHFVQQSIYGYKMEIKYSVYVNTNKNDDDIHVEIVPLDLELGANMIERARKIIFSDAPPPRLSENPTFHKCKACSAVGVCHRKHAVAKNCRSCDRAIPIAEGAWFCREWNAVIPKAAIPDACHKWVPIV